MIQQLIKQIEQKEKELGNLKEQYDKEAQEEKRNTLKSKSNGIKKSLYLLGFQFESSSGRTAQYLEFHNVFKRELKEVLKSHIKEIQISKPNHFDVSGFFKLKNDEIYYFNLGDLRWNKENILIRTAKDFKDYTGGSNSYIKLDDEFINRLFKFLKINQEAI